jgi:hypothetical protein
MKPFCFTFESNPKAVYLLSDIQDYCNNDDDKISMWTNNPDIIILNDNSSALILPLDNLNIDKYMESINELEKKLFNNE